MWFTSAQFSVSSRIYDADSESTDSVSVCSFCSPSIRLSYICLTRRWLWFCPWGGWYCPLRWFRRGGIGSTFEQGLSFSYTALGLLDCALVNGPGMKIPPPLKHSSLFVLVCWVGCFCLVLLREGLFEIAPTWLFKFGVDERNISLWFSCPRSLDSAKFSTWAGVRTIERSSICIVLLLIFAMKKSFIRSSSKFRRAHFEPNSHRLLFPGFVCCVGLLWGIYQMLDFVGGWMLVLVYTPVHLLSTDLS